MSSTKVTLSLVRSRLKLIEQVAESWGDCKLSTTSFTTDDFHTLTRWIDLFASSRSLQDLCKQVVHTDAASGECRGAHVYALNHKSNLVPIAGYGIDFAPANEELTSWGEDELSSSIREKKCVFTSEGRYRKESPILALPLLKDSTPMGCMVLVMREGTEGSPLPDSIFSSISKLGAYFLETHAALPSLANGRPSGSVDDLTTRQVTIIGLIGQGMTNAEIAREILLSESTVRQETIRIYRSLGVGNRQDALLKARALGLLPTLA